MHKFRIFSVLAIIIGTFAGSVFLFSKPAEGVYFFADMAGPKGKSVLPENHPASWSDYHGGSDSRFVILLTQPKSNWLGLAHGFKSIGLPFTITTDYHEALQHKVIMLYPAVAGSHGDNAHLLNEFVRNGGTLIGSEVLDGDMLPLFGFSKSTAFHERTKLKFTNPAPDADPLEKEIPIDNPEAGKDSAGAYGYTGSAERPLAVYEDGSPAIIQHKIGNGRAIAFGFDLGALLLRGYNNRQENMARSYDNGYEPTLDVLLRMIEDIYRRGDDRAVTIAPVPEGKKLAVMMTHDIDYTRSLFNAIDYAEYEHEIGIPATYFMQTKYIRDYNDEVILDKKSPHYLNKLHDLGMEIGSHTVSHSHAFTHFQMGDGSESYPAYHPFVFDRDTTTGGTIMGELRVSRFLIEQLVPNVHIDSFRPGYLANPYPLPQALVATDYRFSSSVTANDSLTHLPFQLDYGRETTGEVPVFEFPITIADGPPILTDRLPDGIVLAKKIARKGGLCVLLIHPDMVEPKLGFEKQFVAGVRDISWFGTISGFGHWWAARNEVQIDSHWEDGKLKVRIKSSSPIDGLTIQPPADLHPAAGQGLIKQSSNLSVTLGKIDGTADIIFIR